MSRNWDLGHEMNLADGTANEWRLMVVQGIFYWIDSMSDGTFNVIAPDGHTGLMNCKSLASAKRWVRIHLYG